MSHCIIIERRGGRIIRICFPKSLSPSFSSAWSRSNEEFNAPYIPDKPYALILFCRLLSGFSEGDFHSANAASFRMRRRYVEKDWVFDRISLPELWFEKAMKADTDRDTITRSGLVVPA